MLDVGFSEILLTSAIALIVLGPERLPKVARQVGNWMGRARAMARQLSEQLEREVSAEELLKTQPSPNRGGSPSSAAVETIAAPTDTLPPVVDVPLTEDSRVPEPSFGLDASLTTPAAMHASETASAEHKPLANDAKPTHE